jgi:4-hydroxy-tetrahydrodipicolinate reductase
MSEGIKVVLCGAGGRMGDAVIDCFAGEADVVVAYGVEQGNHKAAGQKLKGVPIVSELSSVIQDGDCVLDFSAPGFAQELIADGEKYGKPLVIGTTNQSEESLKKMKAASKKIPIVFSPNMSPGMNVLFKIGPRTANALGKDFDVSIVETHHKQKKDSPSGTARRLAELVKETTGEEPQVRSLRIGDVIGEHVISFANEGEELVISHRALSRRAFAHGALLAVRFAVRARPGLYDMSDVLGLR